MNEIINQMFLFDFLVPEIIRNLSRFCTASIDFCVNFCIFIRHRLLAWLFYMNYNTNC